MHGQFTAIGTNGMLRVSVATDFGSMHLSLCWVIFSAISRCVRKFGLDNRYIEMIMGYDAAIRAGDLKTARFAHVKSRKQNSHGRKPGYLQRAGRPRRIEDLGAHKLLHYTNQANGAVWKMTSQTGANADPYNG